MTEEEFQQRLQVAHLVQNQENQKDAYKSRWLSYFKKVARQQQAHLSAPKMLSPGVIHHTIDADGDQVHKELKLYLTLSGNVVNIKVSYLLGEKDKKAQDFKRHNIGDIIVPHPELFLIWNEIPSDGHSPYFLFLSLPPFARAFMDDYNELPDKVYQNIIHGIEDGTWDTMHESVITDPVTNEKIIENDLNFIPNKSINPFNVIDIIDGQEKANDALAIYYSIDYEVGQAIYAFTYGGKTVGSFASKIVHGKKPTPIITEKVADKKDSKREKLTTLKRKEKVGFQTLSILVKAGRENKAGRNDYRLLLFPAEEEGKAELSVSIEGWKPWPHTMLISMPYDKEYNVAYTTEEQPDHLNIYFHPSGQQKGDIPDLTLRTMVMVTAPASDASKVKFPKHRTEALRVYAKDGSMRTFALYYRKGHLVTKNPDVSSDLFHQDAVEHAYKYVPKPIKSKTLAELQDQLNLQEILLMSNIWQKEGRTLSFATREKKLEENVSMVTQKEKKPTLRYFKQYLTTMIAVQQIIPAINKVKLSKKMPVDPDTISQFMVTLGIVRNFETWVKQALAASTGDKTYPVLNPKLSAVLESDTPARFALIDGEKYLKVYQQYMLLLTQSMLKDDLKEENPVLKRKKYEGIDKIGNRRKNLVSFAQKKGIPKNKEVQVVTGYFYPKTDWYNEKYKDNAGLKQFLESSSTPHLEVPFYFYKGEPDYNQAYTWHIVSTFNKNLGNHYYNSLTLHNREDQKKYSKNPPPALFDLLNHHHHLPDGWLIFNLPNGQKVPPLKISTNWKSEDIAFWLTMAAMTIGSIAFGFGALGIANLAFTVGTVVGGAIGVRVWLRKSENGSLTYEDKLFTLLDFMSAFLAVFQLGVVVKYVQGLALYGKVGSWIYVVIQGLDFGVDTVVIGVMSTKGWQQIKDIIDGPGSLKDKMIAATKVGAALAVQGVFYAASLPSRGRAITDDIRVGIGKLPPPRDVASKIKKLKIDPTEDIELHEFMQKGWSKDVFQDIYETLGKEALAVSVKALSKLDAVELSVLRQLYTEEDLLRVLFYKKGDIKETRRILAAHYDIVDEASVFNTLKKHNEMKAEQPTAKKRMSDGEAK